MAAYPVCATWLSLPDQIFRWRPSFCVTSSSPHCDQGSQEKRHPRCVVPKAAMQVREHGTTRVPNRFLLKGNRQDVPMVEPKQRSSERGFASMDPEKQRSIARKGGESVPSSKRSFSQDPGLASQAGRKGGASVPAEKRSFSQNHDLAAQAGRKGGESVPREKRSFSQNHDLAAQAGRKGGESVPAAKRSFSQNRGLAAEAGRKGGESRSR